MGQSGAAAEASGDREFVDCCRWVAEAFEAGDAQQIAAASCAMYRLLASCGWTPSASSSILLRLHAALVDVELARMLEPASPSA